MRKLLALLPILASPALAQTPAGVINAPIYATGYISQVGGTNVTTNIPPQPNHPTNLNIYTTGSISGTWTIKLPNPAFEGQILSFNCGAAANAISVISFDGSTIDSTLPTSCSINSGFTIQFDQRSNIWRNIGSNNTSIFKPFTGISSQWPWQLNTDGTWTLKQPDAADVTYNQGGTNAVTRTLRARLQDSVSVADFGAVADSAAIGSGTDNLTKFNSAAAEAIRLGKPLYIPGGANCYRLSGAFVLDQTAITTEYGPRISIHGDVGSSCINFDNGTFDGLVVNGSTTDPNWYAEVSGLRLFKGDLQGGGLILKHIGIATIRNVLAQGWAIGSYSQDVNTISFYDPYFSFNTKGMYLERLSWSYPNAINIFGGGLANNYTVGLEAVSPTTINLYGTVVAGNGTMGVGVGGVNIVGCPVEGKSALNVHDVYFEINRGTADVLIGCSATSMAATITGSTFNRISSTDYVTNNVVVTGTAVVNLDMSGNAFARLGTYVANAGRPYLNFTNTNARVSWSQSNTMSDAGTEGTLPTNVSTDITPLSPVSNHFVTGATSGGSLTHSQPAFSNLSGSATCAQLPALTGDATTSAGSCAVSVTATGGVAFGTAATKNTGTSGTTIPLLDGGNTWSGTQVFAAVYGTFGSFARFVGNTAVPTLSSCGTSPTIASDSTSTSGTVTVGTGAPSSCTISTVTRSNNYTCVVSSPTGTAVSSYTTTTSTLVINFPATSSAKFTYVCMGA